MENMQIINLKEMNQLTNIPPVRFIGPNHIYQQQPLSSFESQSSEEPAYLHPHKFVEESLRLIDDSIPYDDEDAYTEENESTDEPALTEEAASTEEPVTTEKQSTAKEDLVSEYFYPYKGQMKPSDEEDWMLKQLCSSECFELVFAPKIDSVVEETKAQSGSKVPNYERMKYTAANQFVADQVIPRTLQLYQKFQDSLNNTDDKHSFQCYILNDDSKDEYTLKKPSTDDPETIVYDFCPLIPTTSDTKPSTSENRAEMNDYSDSDLVCINIKFMDDDFETTENPTTTENGQTKENPETTEKPETTEEPETTEKSEAKDKREKTKKPEKLRKPKKTEKPEKTKKSETLKKKTTEKGDPEQEPKTKEEILTTQETKTTEEITTTKETEGKDTNKTTQTTKKTETLQKKKTTEKGDPKQEPKTKEEILTTQETKTTEEVTTTKETEGKDKNKTTQTTKKTESVETSQKTVLEEILKKEDSEIVTGPHKSKIAEYLTVTNSISVNPKVIPPKSKPEGKKSLEIEPKKPSKIADMLKKFDNKKDSNEKKPFEFSKKNKKASEARLKKEPITKSDLNASEKAAKHVSFGTTTNAKSKPDMSLKDLKLIKMKDDYVALEKSRRHSSGFELTQSEQNEFENVAYEYVQNLLTDRILKDNDYDSKVEILDLFLKYAENLVYETLDLSYLDDSSNIVEEATIRLTPDMRNFLIQKKDSKHIRVIDTLKIENMYNYLTLSPMHLDPDSEKLEILSKIPADNSNNFVSIEYLNEMDAQQKVVLFLGYGWPLSGGRNSEMTLEYFLYFHKIIMRDILKIKDNK